MAEVTLQGSGGHVTANLTEKQSKKADLGVGKLFLAPVGKIDSAKMIKYYCNTCNTQYQRSPVVRPEANEGEEKVSENMMLVERGQYVCEECDSIIGEYRVFRKNDESSDAGSARPTES